MSVIKIMDTAADAKVPRPRTEAELLIASFTMPLSAPLPANTGASIRGPLSSGWAAIARGVVGLRRT